MAHEILDRMLAAKTEETRLAQQHAQQAGRKLADDILAEYENKHLVMCEKQGKVTTFIVQLPPGVEDAVVEAALTLCAEHTDRTGNALTRDYVWLDTDNPDALKQMADMVEAANRKVAAVAGAAASIGAIAATAVLFPPAIPLLVLETITTVPFLLLGSGGESWKPRMVMYAPSAFRAQLRTPVRAYNIVNGHVTTVTELATQAASLATSAMEAAGQGASFLTGLFTRKT